MIEKIFGRQKPIKTAKAGEWTFEWYYNEKEAGGCYMRMASAATGMFELRISGLSPAYGYLLAAAEQGRDDQLAGFATLMYVAGTVLTQDQGFVDGMNKEIGKWLRRVEKKATTEAKKVSDAEDEAARFVMEDVAAYADAPDGKTRKYMREGWKDEFIKYIKDGDTTDNH